MSLQEILEIILWIVGLFLGMSQLIYGLKNYFSKSGYIPSFIIKIRVWIIGRFLGEEKGEEYLEQTIKTRNQKYWGANYIFVGVVVVLLSLFQIITILK